MLTIASTEESAFALISIQLLLTQNLNGVLLGDEVDNLEGVLDDTDSHELLSVVPAVHHEAESQL